jgi:hypothetical protein
MTTFKSFLNNLKPTDPTLIGAIETGFSLLEAWEDDDLFNELVAAGFGQESIPTATMPPTIEKTPIKDGGTVTAMHGSLAKFDKFSYDKIGANFPNTKDGFFFSTDFDYIDALMWSLSKKKSGTPSVYTCKLTLGRTYTLKNYFESMPETESQHIYDITNGDPIDIFDSYRTDIIKKAKENKCNSINFRSLYIVFDSNQIDIIDRKEFEPYMTAREKRRNQSDTTR